LDEAEIGRGLFGLGRPPLAWLIVSSTDTVAVSTQG